MTDPYFMFGDYAQAAGGPPMKPRDRTREKIGKSEKSHIKHRLITSVVQGQIHAYRHINPRAKIVLIDGNAGDGEGVPMPQLDLLDSNLSTTTAEVLADIANKFGASLILCEKDRDRRASLSAKFSSAVILNDNAKAPGAIPSDCGYALWVSDPCGPAGHGVEAMKAVGLLAIKSDFVIAMNEGAIKRIEGTNEEQDLERVRKAHATSRERYVPMLNDTYWADELRRAHLSRTPVIDGAKNFKYRIFVAANYLAQPATRHPFEVIK